MEEKRMEIGQQIRFYRKKQRLTQRQLAELLCLSPAAISKWESGQSLPDLPTLARLSLLFEVSCDRLIFGKEQK